MYTYGDIIHLSYPLPRVLSYFFPVQVGSKQFRFSDLGHWSSIVTHDRTDRPVGPCVIRELCTLTTYVFTYLQSHLPWSLTLGISLPL